jgi:TIGR03009 family protein
VFRRIALSTFASQARVGESMMPRIGWPVMLLLLAASCTAASAAKLPPPFKATSDEEQKVDRLLTRWQQWNAGVKNFNCSFKRWTYDATFGPAMEAKYIDLGRIEFAAPNRAFFRVDMTEKAGKPLPVEDARAEHWVCDGRSIIEFNHVKQQMIEHKLPPELQGTKLVDGPLTFAFAAGVLAPLFGMPACPYPFAANPKLLKEQFYLREITPSGERRERVWLEGYPRSSAVAANCQRLQLIFRAGDMSPIAMRMVQPNGKDSVVYQFYDASTNGLGERWGDDPFQPSLPRGWQKIVAEPPAAVP